MRRVERRGALESAGVRGAPVWRKADGLGSGRGRRPQAVSPESAELPRERLVLTPLARRVCGRPSPHPTVRSDHRRGRGG